MTYRTYHEYQALLRAEGIEGIRQRDPDHPWFAEPKAKRLAPDLDPWTFVTTARLVADTQRLFEGLPTDLDMVVAIPRSGLLPGAIIAYSLHLPLLTVSRQTGLSDPGHGIRLQGQTTTTPGHILLIDDTAATGREMRECLPVVQAAYPDVRVTRAVIYSRPEGLHAIDFCVSVYPGLHFLSWNFCNAGHGEKCAFDMDGLICRDFTLEECRTDESYRAAMTTISPLYLPRRLPVPLIVTARPENTRGLTLDWLARHRVTVDRLIMKDWETDPDRDWNTQIGEWKARHYRESSCVLFAESDKDQAKIIAEISGKGVLCPSMGRVIPPRQPLVNTLDKKTLAAILGCTHRRSTCSCLDRHATCSRPDRLGAVHLADCVACVEADACEPNATRNSHIGSRNGSENTVRVVSIPVKTTSVESS